MRRILLPLSLALGMLLVATPALADEYEGWEEIRPALVDGEGNEFVTPVGAGQESAGYWIGWVAEQAQTPGNWVVDTVETWTASDQMFTKLQGDCEDWAILLCALLRFHTPDGGVPADRVWISVNLVTAPGLGVVAAHAWVGFKLERGGLVYIEPGTGYIYRGRPQGMLSFNDEWVRGGGPYLAGPRY